MIKPDVNLLVYAHDDTSSFHESASLWFEEVLSTEQVFFSWHTICGFLRVVTNNKIYKNPITTDQAIDIVDSWLERENTHLVSLEKRNWHLFAKMLTDGQANGNLVMDAHIAALAASCGATVASTDRDFTRFPGLQFTNPIAKT
ncbi:MAG: TA system VapC family ribonuclease toxin [Pyrinomonadaceae bacterium]